MAERLRAPLSAVREASAYGRTVKDIEICHTPDTGILCLRALPRPVAPEQADALQAAIHRRIQSGGERSISITSLGGRKALRLLAVSPGVTAGDLKETIDVIREAAESLDPSSAAGACHD